MNYVILRSRSVEIWDIYGVSCCLQYHYSRRDFHYNKVEVRNSFLLGYFALRYQKAIFSLPFEETLRYGHNELYKE